MIAPKIVYKKRCHFEAYMRQIVETVKNNGHKIKKVVTELP